MSKNVIAACGSTRLSPVWGSTPRIDRVKFAPGLMLTLAKWFWRPMSLAQAGLRLSTTSSVSTTSRAKPCSEAARITKVSSDTSSPVLYTRASNEIPSSSSLSGPLPATARKLLPRILQYGRAAQRSGASPSCARARLPDRFASGHASPRVDARASTPAASGRAATAAIVGRPFPFALNVVAWVQELSAVRSADFSATWRTLFAIAPVHLQVAPRGTRYTSRGSTPRPRPPP
mmetsp:Transcript_36827/g.102196  ORF Transcript_36827/g.102196 Transcript_36827/m.102196 type:complete len:232 (-) Transcript_36827:2-697(-)